MTSKRVKVLGYFSLSVSKIAFQWLPRRILAFMVDQSIRGENAFIKEFFTIEGYGNSFKLFRVTFSNAREVYRKVGRKTIYLLV